MLTQFFEYGTISSLRFFAMHAPMRTVFVIEGKGKIDTLGRIIRELAPGLGLGEVEVVATKGHLCENPNGFAPLGLDADWCETAYEPSPSRFGEIDEIRRAAATARGVFIATDDDQEGDVIARDVARVALGGLDIPVKRCRLRAMDHSMVRQAIRQALPLDPLLALHGDARRIADRAIGGVLSDVSIAKNKRPVGRVFSTVLAVLAESAPQLGVVRASVPAADGGKPFVGMVPYTRECNLEALGGEVRAEARVGERTRGAIVTPMNFADIVAVVSEEANVTIRQAAQGLQLAYEQGRVSYPRSGARTLSEDGLAVCKALAERNGCTFHGGRIGGFSAGQHAHEAPRLLHPVILGRAARAGGDLVEVVVQAIGRRLVESGQDHMIERPAVDDLPEWLRAHASRLARTRMDGWLSWRGPRVGAALTRYSKEVALLRVLEDNGLGRPATWVGHVETLLARGVVNDDLSLNARGKDLLDLARSRGIGRDFSAAIEAAIAAGGNEPANTLARRALGSASEQAFRIIDAALERSVDAALEAQ
jgi:DNA topoisomerase I